MNERTLSFDGSQTARWPVDDVAPAPAETGATAFLALPVLLGAAIRFYRLGAQSFWYDEAVSADLSGHGFWELVAGKVRDLGNPPLHSLLLHGWSLLFGSSDAALRGLSAVAGTLAIPLLYATARRLAGTGAARGAAWLFAIAPFHVYLAQEARTYALVTLLGLSSIYALLRALDQPRAIRWWAAHALVTFGAIYSHYFAFLLVLAETAFVVLAHRRDHAVLLRFAISLAAAAMLFATWLPAFLEQLGTRGNLSRYSDTWYLHAIATPLVYSVGTTLVWKQNVSLPRLALGGVAAAAALVALAAGVRALRGRREALLTLLWLGVPVLVPFLLSALVSPMYAVRYGALASPAFYILVAAGLDSLRRSLAGACAGLLVVAGLASLWSYFSSVVKHDWRSAAAYVESRARKDDLVLFDADFNETAYARYAADPRERIRLLPGPQTVSSLGRIYGVFRPKEPVRDMSDTIASKERVWLVLSDAAPGRSDDEVRSLERGWKDEAHATFRGIDVRLYTRRSAAAPVPLATVPHDTTSAPGPARPSVGEVSEPSIQTSALRRF